MVQAFNIAHSRASRCAADIPIELLPEPVNCFKRVVGGSLAKKLEYSAMHSQSGDLGSFYRQKHH